MKQYLGIYNDIIYTTSSEEAWCAQPDSSIVEAAKLTYSNVKDNHQLRSDPDIAGIYKFERIDVMTPSPSVSGGSNVDLEAFFSPLCDKDTMKEWFKRFSTSSLISTKDE